MIKYPQFADALKVFFPLCKYESVAAIFFIHLFKHPEIVTLFRVVRVFRIIRIFEIHKSLKQTERKIMSVIPTVMVFAILLAFIHFVYAIIGCNLYDFKKINNLS